MNEDILELKKRWQEVVKTCGIEVNKSVPLTKELWENAKKAAEDYVAFLESGRKLELAACKAWKTARASDPSKIGKKADLKLVEMADNDEDEPLATPEPAEKPAEAPALKIVGPAPVPKAEVAPAAPVKVNQPSVVVDTYGIPGLKLTV